MRFKKFMIPLCMVIWLIILFIMLHLLWLGPIPVTSIRIDGWEIKTVSSEEIKKGLKDFSYAGEYIKSETGDPWIFLDGADVQMSFLYVDIEDLSEQSTSMQVFFYKNGTVFHSQNFSLTQGENILCLEKSDYDQIRLDLTNQYGHYFLINKICFTNNYFLAIPAWFWVIYSLISAVVIVLMLLFVGGKLSKTDGTENKSIYWTEWVGFIRNSVLEHKKAFLIGSIVVVLIFGYEITNFTLGVDEEREIVHSYGTTENIDTSKLSGGEGRYATGLIKHFLSTNNVFTPYFDTLVAVLGIAVAAMVNIISFEKCSGKRFRTSSCILFMGLFCSLPYVITEWMCYSIMNSSMSMGILLVSLAIYSVCVPAFPGSTFSIPKKQIYLYLILPSVLCAFTIAIVESLAPLFMISACFCVLFYVIENHEAGFKQFFQKAAWFIVPFVVGFILYNIVKFVLGTNGYTGQYIHWGKEEFSEIVKGWIGYLDYVFNTEIPGSALSAISVLGFALMLILIGISQKKAGRFLLIVFNGLCCFMSAFALMVVTGGFIPLRTMIPLMLLTSAPWIIAIEYLASYKLLKIVPVAVSAVILLYQSIWVNKIFTGANLCAQLDMEMGYDIGVKVMEEFPDSCSQKPLVFVGRYQHPSPSIIKIDAVGQSIFLRNRSSYKVYLLRHLGFNFIHSSTQQIAEAGDYAKDMPIYPANGCIQEFDDIIVVRLS